MGYPFGRAPRPPPRSASPSSTSSPRTRAPSSRRSRPSWSGRGDEEGQYPEDRRQVCPPHSNERYLFARRVERRARPHRQGMFELACFALFCPDLQRFGPGKAPRPHDMTARPVLLAAPTARPCRTHACHRFTARADRTRRDPDWAGSRRPCRAAWRVRRAGAPDPHARRQLWNWLDVQGATDFARMTNIAKEFRAELEGNFTLPGPRSHRACVIRRHAQMAASSRRRQGSRDGLHPRRIAARSAFRARSAAPSPAASVTRARRSMRNLEPRRIVGQIMVARDRLGDWPGATAEDQRGIPDPIVKSPTSCSWAWASRSTI